jgi:hypothetical protein
MGKGDQVYQRLVKTKCVTLDKVVNHFAISSLFEDEEKEKQIFSFRVEKIHYEKVEKENNLLVVGQVRVASDIIPEPKEFLFGLIPSEKAIFRTWISENNESISFDRLREKGFEALGRGEGEMAKVLSSSLGNRTFTIQDTFKEKRQTLFQNLIQREFDEHCQIYADLFDRTKLAVEALSKEGLEIPLEIRVAAEITLSHRLFQEIQELKKSFKTTQERGEIVRIIEEAKEHGYHLRQEKSLLALNEILKEKMEALQENRDSNLSRHSERAEQVEEVISLLDLTKKWGFELPLEEAQNLMKEIVNECVGNLEKCWWGGDATPESFPPNLITLAEKLGFNVEGFLHMA